MQSRRTCIRLPGASAGGAVRSRASVSPASFRGTAGTVYVVSHATLITIRNNSVTSASAITLAVQIRTSHPMRRGQGVVGTLGRSTISQALPMIALAAPHFAARRWLPLSGHARPARRDQDPVPLLACQLHGVRAARLTDPVRGLAADQGNGP